MTIIMLRDLWGLNKVLLLLNEHENPSFLFQNFSSCNIYILLDVLLCSIAVYFYELYRILTSP